MENEGGSVFAWVERMAREHEELASDPGYIAQREREKRERQSAYDAWRLRSWRSAYLASAPVRNAQVAWDASATPAVLAVKDWLANPSRHLVLRGGVGCGKTTAACVAVKHWCEPSGHEPWSGWQPSDSTGRTGFISWLRPDQLVSAVLHDYDEKSPKLRKYIVVDDMGLETKADFAVAMCELLDREGHTLLITTNLPKQRMRERYDVRLLDRLNDTARAVDLPEKSMRKQDGGF